VESSLSEEKSTRLIIEFKLHKSTNKKCKSNWILRTLWRPRFSAGLINPNDPVNGVDFGQTTVNLGHHLENITDNP
jgi:hypothetical protein